jgi:TolB protein
MKPLDGTARTDFDTNLSVWLDERTVARAPERLLERALERTERTRPRPAWRIPERWIPMALVTSRSAVAPTLRAAWLVLLVGLLIAALVTSAVLGTQLLRAVSPTPTGDAGILVYGSDGDLYTMRDDGTDRRQLTSGSDLDFNALWSPDGSRIAFFSDTFAEPFEPVLKVMDADGSNVHIVSGDIPITSDYWRSVAWSPDASQLLFADEKVGLSSIYRAEADGSGVVRLDVGIDDAMHPAWSPDGKHIAFHGRRSGSTESGVYVVGSDGSDARLVSAPGIGYGEDRFWPRWSLDSTRLAYAIVPPQGAEADIVVVGVDGTAEQVIVPGDTTQDLDPVWSPDGSRIAFRRHVSGANDESWWDTYVWDASDGSITRVDLPASYGGPAQWSPDGARLIVEAKPIEGEPEGSDHFLIATIDGSEPMVDLPVTWSNAPSWKPTRIRSGA